MNLVRAGVFGFVVVLSGCDCGVGVMGDPDGGAVISNGDGSVTFDAGAPDAGVDAGVDAGFDAGPPGELEAAVVDDRGDLWALTADGGARFLVGWQDAGLSSYVRGPRWQPNGTRLAFTDGERPWLAEADGGLTPLQLTVTADSPYQGSTERVEWSPDGTRLAIDGRDFLTDLRAVFLLPVDGGTEPELLGDARHWAWSGDGASVFFSRFVGMRQTDVTWRYDLATADAGEFATAMLLDVSRGGVAVLQRTLLGSDGGTEYALEATPSSGATFELLPRNAVAISSGSDGVTFNPAGTELALRGTVTVNGMGLGFKALRLRLDGGVSILSDRATADADFPSCLRYLPDGEVLSLFTSETPPTLQLAAPDGGRTTRATPTLGNAAQLGCLDWHLRRD